MEIITTQRLRLCYIFNFLYCQSYVWNCSLTMFGDVSVVRPRNASFRTSICICTFLSGTLPVLPLCTCRIEQSQDDDDLYEQACMRNDD